MTSIALLLLMFGFAIVGHQFLNAATDIAIEQNTNVWTASRREWGIAMACYLLALLFGFLAINTVPADAAVDPHAGSLQVVHITDDPGGSVGLYYQKYKALSDAGTEIHFHGMCASSCTIVLFTEFTGIKACADEGAIFAFHKPFQEKEGKIDRSKKAAKETHKLWAMWIEELPPQLRKYLKSVHVPSATEGDEQNTLLLIPANMLLPKCPVTEAAK